MFDNKYGYKMPRIATLAYDAVALSTTLATIGDYSNKAITNPRGFSGIDGIFRFNSGGLAERGLAILEIRDNNFTILDAAPSFFE
jgi:hypothetical protein